jgi:hypothetical protein
VRAIGLHDVDEDDPAAVVGEVLLAVGGTGQGETGGAPPGLARQKGGAEDESERKRKQSHETRINDCEGERRV